MSYFQQDSECLYFRKLTEEDIPSWIPFFKNNDHLRFLGLDLERDIESLAREWILKQLDRYEQQGFGHLAAIRKSDGAFIGMGGIIPRALNDRTYYEIVYSLKQEYWRQGYGTELARQMRKYGAQNIDTDQLISIIHIENMGSIRVAQNNGMEFQFATQFMGMPVHIFGVENKQHEKRDKK